MPFRFKPTAQTWGPVLGVWLCLGSAAAWAQPATANSQAAGQYAGQAVSATPWSLDDLVLMALQSHPGVASARSQLGASRADVSSARSQFLPTPSFQLLRDKGDFTRVLTVQQPIWSGGKLEAGLDAAQSRAVAAAANVQVVRYELALRVVSAWSAWLSARSRADALEKGLALLGNYGAAAARRAQAGAAPEIDQELITARQAQTRGDLSQARAAERIAAARLQQLTGASFSTRALAVPDATEVAPPLPASRDTWVELVTSRSASIRRVQADIVTASHEIEQMRSQMKPTLSLRAQHQRGTAPVIGVAANDSRIMLVLDISPGAGLSLWSNIEAAQARREALLDKLDAVRRDLSETVLADLEEYQSVDERRKALQQSIRSGTAVLESNDRLFMAGRRSLLDLVNAARDLTQSQVALAELNAQQLAAQARLRLHAGELQ